MLKENLARLQQEALQLGATGAAVITSMDIRAVEELAALCNGEYVCPSYGLAASCPPHVKGPGCFRRWQEKSRYAITVKIELPSSIFFSDERKDVMRLLHTVVAGVEKKAVRLGFTKSKAFAGGSCKPLFCGEYETCCVVEDQQPCRHKDEARPSMSGFGIDVVRLMKASGWPVQKTSGSDDLRWVAGLILIAE